MHYRNLSLIFPMFDENDDMSKVLSIFKKKVIYKFYTF